MKVELPDAVRPVWNLLVHISIGAILLAAMLAIEVLLAGFVRLLGMIPFAPGWLKEAAEPMEQGLFLLDLFVVGLFLTAEVVKLLKGFWKEIRHG